MSGLFVSRPAFVAVAALALSVCGCGSGSNVPVLSLVAAPSPTPAVAAGTTFTSAPATVSIVADTPLTLPYGGDFPAAPTIQLSAQAAPFPAGANFTVVASSALANDIPALDRARESASLRAIRSLPAAPLFVLSFVSNVSVPLTAAPAFRFPLPQRALVPGVRYWLALLDVSTSAGWQYGFEGPGALAGNVVSFAGGNPLRFPAGSRMIVVLYALPASLTPPTPRPSASPLPSPSPSVVPSASPTPTPVVSPAPGLTLSQPAMVFNGLRQTMTSTVSQPGYAGRFTVASGNPGVATATISGSTVTVTSVATGTTSIVVTGGNGQHAPIAVSVTTFSIGVY